MSDAHDSAATTDRTSPRAGLRRTRAGLRLGVLALVVSVVLISLVLPVAAVLPAALLAALLAIVAIVLGIRTRRAAAPRGSTPSVAAASLAIVLDVIVIVIMSAGVLGGNGLAQVEVRATGGPVFRVSFADDTRSYDEEWDSSGWKRYTTAGDSAQIAVTAPADASDQEVTCAIVWNGEVVVEQTGSGSVTCRYVAD